MKKSKKNRAIIVLIVLLLALAIGYAAFQTVLTVNGTATGTMDWDVHFTDKTTFYEVTNNAKGAEITNAERADAVVETSTTTGQNQSQSVTATVALKYPGDAVILETEIENLSTQPAKLTGYTIEGAENGLVILDPNTSAIVTGTVGSNTGDVLNANGGKCKAQFLVKWNADAATFGDSTNHKQTFKIKFTYSQDTEEKSLETRTHSDNQ